MDLTVTTRDEDLVLDVIREVSARPLHGGWAPRSSIITIVSRRGRKQLRARDLSRIVLNLTSRGILESRRDRPAVQRRYTTYYRIKGAGE